MGETCGSKLVHHESVTKGDGDCKLCQEIQIKARRLRKENDNITRWNNEGNKFSASIEKAQRESAALQGQIQDLYSRRPSIGIMEQVRGLGAMLPPATSRPAQINIQQVLPNYSVARKIDHEYKQQKDGESDDTRKDRDDFEHELAGRSQTVTEGVMSVVRIRDPFSALKQTPGSTYQGKWIVHDAGRVDPKRPLNTASQDNEDDDQETHDGRKRKVIRDRPHAGRIWACPFWKHDPSRYSLRNNCKCSTHLLDSTPRLK